MKIKLIIIISLITFIFNKNILNAAESMAGTVGNDNTNILVMIIPIIIWAALGTYIYSLKRKVTLLEKKLGDE